MGLLVGKSSAAVPGYRQGSCSHTSAGPPLRSPLYSRQVDQGTACDLSCWQGWAPTLTRTPLATPLFSPPRGSQSACSWLGLGCGLGLAPQPDHSTAQSHSSRCIRSTSCAIHLKFPKRYAPISSTCANLNDSPGTRTVCAGWADGVWALGGVWCVAGCGVRFSACWLPEQVPGIISPRNNRRLKAYSKSCYRGDLMSSCQSLLQLKYLDKPCSPPSLHAAEAHPRHLFPPCLAAPPRLPPAQQPCLQLEFLRSVPVCVAMCFFACKISPLGLTPVIFLYPQVKPREMSRRLQHGVPSSPWSFGGQGHPHTSSPV